MDGFAEIMVGPLIACLILTGIHTYLGLHVIERGVIFVDLALAQMAALGATVGFLLGFELHTFSGYLCSLLFAMAGAGVFALSRFRRQVIPQEAVIGVVYAVAGAGAILILSRAPEGGEELKALMVGHLLFVSWGEILKVLLLYSLVGIVHWVFRNKFFLLTRDAEGAFDRGEKVRLWDFLFYATFALVVTSSVELAGVLLVFCFLTVPALCGILLAESVRSRLLVGWAVGFVASAVGMVVSFQADLPTGATVVCTLGALLALVFLLAAMGVCRVRGSR
jgi:zinc/manganese transport system permease protein